MFERFSTIGRPLVGQISDRFAGSCHKMIFSWAPSVTTLDSRLCQVRASLPRASVGVPSPGACSPSSSAGLRDRVPPSRAVFAGYCQAFADFRKLTEQLNGMVSWVWQSESGYRQVIPEVGLRKEAWGRVIQSASKLGLTPADRFGPQRRSRKTQAREQIHAVCGAQRMHVVSHGQDSPSQGPL